jgi:uncharacterized membrane protein (UPF0182 family)
MRLVIVGMISIIALLAVIPSWIQNWLWMRELGYTGVFWNLLSVRWKLSCAAFIVTLLYLWITLRFAARNGTISRAGALTSESVLAVKFGIQVSRGFEPHTEMQRNRSGKKGS